MTGVRVVFRKIFLVAYLAMIPVFFSRTALANNLQITNLEVVSQDTTSEVMVLGFDISWDNSWYDGVNYDAVWVVVKYSVDGGTTWKHCMLKGYGAGKTVIDWGIGYQAGSNPAIPMELSLHLQDRNVEMPPAVTQRSVGCFVRRAIPDQSGTSTTNTVTDVRIVWDYAPVPSADKALIADAQLKILGVEMVYIPQGPYWLGDNNTDAGQFRYRYASGNYKSNQIASEDTILFRDADNYWYYATPGTPNTGEDSTGGFTLPSTYPKGFMAFYLMKYEITEGGYVSFLNSLTRTQQGYRVETSVAADTVTNVYVLSSTASSSYRNTVQCPSSGNGTTAPVIFSTSKGDRACNWLQWTDICAYCAWMGLRPYTEMEYEKACRGPMNPVWDEYAWGGTSPVAAVTLSGTEDGTESVTTTSANINFNNQTFSGGDAGQGPLRAGIFAKASTTTRLASGGGYYGNLEMSGNLWERCVSAGMDYGRMFKGTHGSGTLTATYATALNDDWPLFDTASTGVYYARGSGFRGGSWKSPAGSGRVSDRTSASVYYEDTSNALNKRRYDSGGRCARTAQL